MLYDFFIIRTLVPISAHMPDESNLSQEGLALFRIIDVITRYNHPMMVTVRCVRNQYHLKFCVQKDTLSVSDLNRDINDMPVPMNSHISSFIISNSRILTNDANTFIEKIAIE